MFTNDLLALQACVDAMNGNPYHDDPAFIETAKNATPFGIGSKPVACAVRECVNAMLNIDDFSDREWLAIVDNATQLLQR